MSKLDECQNQLAAALDRVAALEGELAAQKAVLARVQAGVDALRDERDRAIADRNTAAARLRDLQRSTGRKPIAGRADPHGLDDSSLNEAIALASAGNRI